MNLEAEASFQLCAFSFLLKIGLQELYKGLVVDDRKAFVFLASSLKLKAES
jgi:hypothetical protein